MDTAARCLRADSYARYNPACGSIRSPNPANRCAVGRGILDGSAYRCVSLVRNHLNVGRPGYAGKSLVGRCSESQIVTAHEIVDSTEATEPLPPLWL